MSPVISWGLINIIANSSVSIGTHIYYVEDQNRAKSLVIQSFKWIGDRNVCRIQSRAVEGSSPGQKLILPSLVCIQEHRRRVDGPL